MFGRDPEGCAGFLLQAMRLTKPKEKVGPNIRYFSAMNGRRVRGSATRDAGSGSLGGTRRSTC